ncbi:MAG: Phosphoglycolate phosphatase [Labilithrix sp.]|nr:Phosphoglycolate phosphatase [Labilithrix sp.]
MTSDLPAPRALLFDLDGTLIDSRSDIAAACNAARVAHGREPLAVETIVSMVGDGARALVARAFAAAEDDPLVEAALATFKASYLAHPCVHTVVLPGVRDVLDVARAASLPCAVVTNKPRDVTLAVLAALEISPFFPVIWAGGDGPLKPAPDGVRNVVARLGVSASAAWMIGDGPQDIGAGKAAGCFTIGVPGIAEHERLVASDPDLLCESLAELAAVLRDLTERRA